MISNMEVKGTKILDGIMLGVCKNGKKARTYLMLEMVTVMIDCGV